MNEAIKKALDELDLFDEQRRKLEAILNAHYMIAKVEGKNEAMAEAIQRIKSI